MSNKKLIFFQFISFYHHQTIRFQKRCLTVLFRLNPKVLQARMFAHLRAYSCVSVRIFVRIGAYLAKFLCVFLRICAYFCVYLCLSMRIYAYAQPSVCIGACARTLCVRTCVHRYACIRTKIRTDTYRYARKYEQIRTEFSYIILTKKMNCPSRRYLLLFFGGSGAFYPTS